MGDWGADGAFAEAWANALHALGGFLGMLQEHWIVVGAIVLIALVLWRWTTATPR